MLGRLKFLALKNVAFMLEYLVNFPSPFRFDLFVDFFSQPHRRAQAVSSLSQALALDSSDRTLWARLGRLATGKGASPDYIPDLSLARRALEEYAC